MHQEPHGPPPTVSKREQQVLQLIWVGLTNQKSAQRLGLSVKTIEAHRASLMPGYAT